MRSLGFERYKFLVFLPQIQTFFLLLYKNTWPGCPLLVRPFVKLELVIMVAPATLTLKLLCVFSFLVSAGLDFSAFIISVPSFTIITKGSTIDDVLGGVKIRRPGGPGKNRISSVQYEQAQNVLNSTRQLLQAIVDSPDTNPEFNLAGVFEVQDYLENGYFGSLCYSDDRKKHSFRDGSRGTVRRCLGNYHDEYSSYFVNETYLITMTTLDEAKIRKLAWDWEGAKLYFIRSTLRINIPTKTLENLFSPVMLFETLVFIMGFLSVMMSTVVLIAKFIFFYDEKVIVIQTVLGVILILKIIASVGFDLSASKLVSGINALDSGLLAVSAGFSLLDGSLLMFGIGTILALITMVSRDMF